MVSGGFAYTSSLLSLSLSAHELCVPHRLAYTCCARARYGWLVGLIGPSRPTDHVCGAFLCGAARLPFPPRTTGELCCLRLGELNAVCKEEQAGGLGGGSSWISIGRGNTSYYYSPRKKGLFFSVSKIIYIFERYYLLL